jgi:uncharacterized membrane protein HdeD (DUF308 family)
MPQYTPSEIVRKASAWSIVWGVALIVLGMLAVGSPLLAAVAVSAAIAWLLVLAGVIHVIVAFHAHSAGSIIWRVLVGLAYICFGIYMVSHPVLSVASLTLVLASLFLVEGIFDLVLFFRVRSNRGSTWVLIDGLVTLALGLMVYMHWPSSSSWAIGTLIGVSMIMSGLSTVMGSLAVRRVADAVSPPSKLAA